MIPASSLLPPSPPLAKADMVATDQLNRLFSDLLGSQQKSSSSAPPIHLWNPTSCGDIDIYIDREGRWFHEGGEIKRPQLVRLFASILLREGDDYFLITPAEKCRIRVAVAPLFVISASREIRDGIQAVSLTTSTGDTVIVDSDHPLFMGRERGGQTEQLYPQVMVRNSIPALISRPVYYQLIDWALEESNSESGGESDKVTLSSMGKQFSLG